ncbi:hypothetical protein Tco_0872681 [Tanacetum coccineum]
MSNIGCCGLEHHHGQIGGHRFGNHTRQVQCHELVEQRVFHTEDSLRGAARSCLEQGTSFQKEDRAAVRAEIEVLRRERLAYEQEGMETRQALARSEAHCRALEARVTVLETEAGARVDTLEDTGSSS